VSWIPGEEAGEVLAGAAADRDRRVLGHAIDLLGRARRASAVDALIGLLGRAERKGSETAGLRGRILEALRKATGKRLEDAASWRAWWEPVRGSFELPVPPPEPTGGEDVLRRIERRGDAHLLRGMAGEDVILVMGGARSVQVTGLLEALRIPHEIRDGDELSGMRIDPASVLILDRPSMSREDKKDLELPPAAAAAVREFVAAGGHLLASGWEAAGVLPRCFPETVTRNPDAFQGEDLEVRPVEESAGHPYLRDVFPENPFRRGAVSWRIGFTVPVPRFDRGKVTALLESRGAAGHEAPAAMAFRHGKGAVLYLPTLDPGRDPRGKAALEMILANFIIEKRKAAHPAPEEARRG